MIDVALVVFAVVLVYYGYLHYKQRQTNKQILADAVAGLQKIADSAKTEFAAIKADVEGLKNPAPKPLPPAAPPPSAP